MKTTSTKILVIPVEVEDHKNDLGLTLPDNYSMQGLEKVEVVYAGEDIKELSISSGANLLIYKGAGTKVIENGKEYRVISITDIVIIYE